MFSSFFKLSWKHGKAILNIFFQRGLAKTDDGDLLKNKSNKMKKKPFFGSYRFKIQNVQPHFETTRIKSFQDLFFP